MNTGFNCDHKPRGQKESLQTFGKWAFSLPSVFAEKLVRKNKSRCKSEYSEKEHMYFFMNRDNRNHWDGGGIRQLIQLNPSTVGGLDKGN